MVLRHLFIHVMQVSLDSNHWLNDPKIGGGRFLGECCHFVDLLFFLSEEKDNRY